MLGTHFLFSSFYSFNALAGSLLSTYTNGITERMKAIVSEKKYTLQYE